MYDLTLPAEKPCSFIVMEPPGDENARFVNPLDDFGFKRIFGNPSRKKILISFLNAVFQGEKVIGDIMIASPEVVGVVKGSKKVIFDLICTGENGEQFIVEMQRGYQDYFTNRLVFYNCRAVSEQLPKGKQAIDFDIKETYSIAILEFNLPDSPENAYLHHARTYYQGSDKLFSGKQQYKLIELPKFRKTIGELATELDKWIYLLKDMRGMRQVPPVFDQDVFREALDIAEISNFNMEDYKMYRSSLQDQHDYENVVAYAKQEAAKVGRREGRQEGRHEKELFVVQTLVRSTDFDDLKIAALAGVEESFVEGTRAEMKL